MFKPNQTSTNSKNFRVAITSQRVTVDLESPSPEEFNSVWAKSNDPISKKSNCYNWVSEVIKNGLTWRLHITSMTEPQVTNKCGQAQPNPDETWAQKLIVSRNRNDAIDGVFGKTEVYVIGKPLQPSEIYSAANSAFTEASSARP